MVRADQCWSFVAVCALGWGGLMTPAEAETREGAVSRQSADTNNVELQDMEVLGIRKQSQRRGALLDVIQKTELVTDDQIEKMHASMLTEAIARETGVRVSNECAMCGVKRVMINGMKGEHTTVLIDGVPLFSAVSGFYGMDAITSAGLGRIEIARGAGASLIAPEAIGGTINLVTKRAVKDETVFDAAIGEWGYQRLSVVNTAVSDDKATRITAAGQFDQRDRYDGDDNGVSENPELENLSVFGVISHDLTERDALDLRLAYYRSSVFGGPMGVDRVRAMSSYVEGTDSSPLDLFENGDVREQFTGAPWETAEIVDTDRREFVARWRHDLNDNTSLMATGAYAEHIQDSFYEGFDYYADDDLYYVDLKFITALGGNHELTYGVDYRDETLRSDSAVVDARDDLDEDSYDHSDLGIYIQDVWSPTDALEVSAALRVDHITVDFVGKDNGDVIDESLLAPRLFVRWLHNEHWTSRISAGKGYRAPLSIFETEHGILSDGFNIAITDIEESLSAGYALSYESAQFSATASLGFTDVENAAATDDSTGIITLINTDETVSATTADLALGYDFSSQWSVGFGVEYYNYDDAYKETLAIAPVETRAKFSLDYTGDRNQFSATLTWLGSRDLEEYGYADRYAVFNDANGDGAPDPGELQAPKSTDAEAYFTLDARYQRNINKTVSVYLGGTNLFDYSHGTEGRSPLLWDETGGYDVVDIFAPLRGRVLYAGFKATF